MSHTVLNTSAIDKVIIEFLSSEIGKAMTFKYQCPNIMLKNTPAVIREPIPTEKDALYNKFSLIRYDKIFKRELMPNIDINEIIVLLTLSLFQ